VTIDRVNVSQSKFMLYIILTCFPKLNLSHQTTKKANE
jgi:hypothetical protein